MASYDKALEFKPDAASAFYNKACCYGLQNNVELALENLEQAIKLDRKYLEMAKTDSDFDRIREDERFQALVRGCLAGSEG
ncbi:MAG: TPR end-of-group domain-containing protein [Microcoleaceae cyanobacterium]